MTTLHFHTLSDDDRDFAVYVGCARQYGAEQRRNADYRPTLRATITGRAAHVRGACGELAFGRMAGLQWSAHMQPEHGAPDYPPDIEIRTTATHYLIVRPKDTQAHLYVAMLEVARYRFALMGCMRGDEARRVGEWRDDAWWVSHRALHAFPLGVAL